MLLALLVFTPGCEPNDPDDPWPPPNIDHDFGEMTDSRDGQTYKTIQIGTQTWMAENLKYLPAVSPSSAGSRTEPYYYVYGYQGTILSYPFTSVSDAKATDNFKTYGVLYNWPAALTACPPGWHLPSDEEWTTLTNFLGDNAGGKMRSTSSLWRSPNTGATNESGWSGLPGGARYHGNFYDLGSFGNWWTASEFDGFFAWYRNLNFYNGFVFRYVYVYYEESGFSVRCLRD